MSKSFTLGPDLDDLSVNEIAWAHPGTVEVFARFGIDMCCGGSVVPEAAAARDGIDFHSLTRALRAAIGEEA